MLALDDAAVQARELIAWADGYQETNEQAARRIRRFCRDVLELVGELSDERRARIAMQGNYNRCLDLMTSRLYRHAVTVAARSNGDAPDELF